LVIYCSPAGTTHHVAQVIEDKLEKLGKKPVTIDIGNKEKLTELEAHLSDLPAGSCIFLGSPVYAYHAIKPVMDIIYKLPDIKGYAVIFATWGAVSSGIALYEMAKALIERGYKVIGAAKIVAVHSMMWKSDSPLGKGHPDDKDDLIVKKMVTKVVEKLSKNNADSVSLEKLNYQPVKARVIMKKASIKSLAKILPSKYLNKDLCNRCGVCMTTCPAHAITFDSYPKFASNCIFCYNCLRLCPENAFQSDFSIVEKHLKNMPPATESPLSQIFI